MILHLYMGDYSSKKIQSTFMKTTLKLTLNETGSTKCMFRLFFKPVLTASAQKMLMQNLTALMK